MISQALSDQPSVLPPTLENDPLPNRRPPVRKRASRALARFLMAFCIGVAATLAWQSYGDAARQIIANSYPQFGWLAERRALTGQKAPDPIARAASPALYPDHELFDAMLRDLHAMRQSVRQIAAGQEQITRTIDQITTTITAGQEQTTRTAEQPATNTAQAPATNAADITVESRVEVRPPQTKQLSATRRKTSDHRREMHPREKEIVGTTEDRLSAPRAPYTGAPNDEQCRERPDRLPDQG
jgi:hypothetical protein